MCLFYKLTAVGCPVCEKQVRQTKEAACPNCEIEMLNVKEDVYALEESRSYNIRSLPGVVIDGVLAACCLNKGIDINVLKSMGLRMKI